MTDYKIKYIKYKKKYLELSYRKDQFGGNKKLKKKNIATLSRSKITTLDMMPSEISIIKEIASGGNGTAYLAIYKNEKLIYKLEKMDVYDKTIPLTSEYYRQVLFDEEVYCNYPDKFMILRKHGIIHNCDYIHPKTDEIVKSVNISDDRKKRFIRKNSQPDCYFLLYSPILDGSYKNVRKIVENDKLLFMIFINQIITGINIMKYKGYYQNDFSSENIMYKLNDTRDMYQWYIIDYGLVSSNKFPESQLDIDIKDRHLYNHPLLNFINNNCINQKFNIYMKENNIEFKNNIFFDNLKKHKIYDKIIKYIPQSITKDKTINEIIKIIAKIKFPKYVLKFMGVTKIIYKNYKSEQLFDDLLLECIKQSDHENYDDLLKIIN